MNYEYDLASYLHHKSMDGDYLCWHCAKNVTTIDRRCKHCDMTFESGKEIIKHLKSVHPIN